MLLMTVVFHSGFIQAAGYYIRGQHQGEQARGVQDPAVAALLDLFNGIHGDGRRLAIVAIPCCRH